MIRHSPDQLKIEVKLTFSVALTQKTIRVRGTLPQKSNRAPEPAANVSMRTSGYAIER